VTFEPPAPQDPYQPPVDPQSVQPYPAVPAKKSHRVLWIVLGSVAGVLVLCCVGALILGAIIGPPKTKPAAGVGTVTTSPPANSSPSPSPSTTPSPAATSTTPTKTANKPTPPNYAAAAAILAASNKHYRDQLAQGQAAFNTAGYAPWFQREQADLESEDAFKQADAYFTADNEPNSINDWRSDMNDATSSFYQWAHAALRAETGAGGPGTVTDEMRGYAQQFSDAMAKADADVANVKAGK
jgi:cytoskeletal protein RodZ